MNLARAMGIKLPYRGCSGRILSSDPSLPAAAMTNRSLFGKRLSQKIRTRSNGRGRACLLKRKPLMTLNLHRGIGVLSLLLLWQMERSICMQPQTLIILLSGRKGFPSLGQYPMDVIVCRGIQHLMSLRCLSLAALAHHPKANR